MSKIINFRKLSQEEEKKARSLWEQNVRQQIVGKTISFTGMEWGPRRHSWEAYTVTVQKVHPSRSANPFDSGIEFQGTNGNNYTIHSDYDVDILD